jgi:hypothetical protein
MMLGGGGGDTLTEADDVKGSVYLEKDTTLKIRSKESQNRKM